MFDTKDGREELLSQDNQPMKASFSPDYSRKISGMSPVSTVHKPSNIHINISPRRTAGALNQDLPVDDRSPKRHLNMNSHQSFKKTEELFEHISLFEKTFQEKSKSPETTSWRSPNPTTGSKHLNPNIIENYLIQHENKKNRKNQSYHGEPTNEESKQEDYEKFKKKNLQCHYRK